MNENTNKYQQIENETADWFARVTAGDLSQAEKAKLAQWKLQSPEHSAAYSAVEQLWSSAESLKGDEDILKALGDIPAAKPSRGPKFLWQSLGSIAATFLLFALARLLFIEPVIESQVYSTAVNLETIELQDGSQVTLDAHSKLIVALSDTSRKLTLQRGRARFDVAKDPARPFSVSTRQGAVTALGTIFDVNLHENAVKVRLLEGMVRLNSTENTQIGSANTQQTSSIMQAGQQATVSRRKGIEAISTITDSSADDWTQGKLVFDNTSIAAVLQDTNRYLPTPVVFFSEEIGNLKVSGTFRSDSPELIIQALLVTFPLELVDQSSQRVLVWDSKRR